MKCLALNTGRDCRLLDHIAPLSFILNIPLLLTDEKNLELTQLYYPQVDLKYIPYDEFSLFDLTKEYDLFLQSTFWDSDLISFFKSLHPKIRFGYCPHGNSDKGHQSPMMAAITQQDFVFLYGKHMVERFQKQNIWQNIPPHIFTGNYRLNFYEHHQKFYDDLADKEIFQKLNPNPTILYAPTWKDEENSTSFFDICQKLVEQLPDHYNLIVKLHPLLEEMDPALFYATMPECQKPNLLFVHEFPPIYPILARTDIFITDLSSIGYDFLYFQKPMFFFNPSSLNESASLFLHQAGCQIPLDVPIYEFIEKNLAAKKPIQKKLYEFAFGNPKSFHEIKHNFILMAEEQRL